MFSSWQPELRIKSAPNIKLISFAVLLQVSMFLPSLTFAQGQPLELMRMIRYIDELFKRSDFDRAGPIADAAVAKYPQSYQAHVLRGVCYHHLEEENKAIAEFKWALERQPKDWNALRYLGLTYFQIGKNDLALKYINDSIAFAPRDAERASIYTHKREILKSMKRNIEAEQAADMAVKLFPAPHWILERMKMRLINGHWQGVIDDGNIVIAKIPKFKERVLAARAKSYIGLKKYPEAQRTFNELFKINPELREARQDQVRLYELTGQSDLAFKEKALIKKMDSTFD